MGGFGSAGRQHHKKTRTKPGKRGEEVWWSMVEGNRETRVSDGRIGLPLSREEGFTAACRSFPAL